MASASDTNISATKHIKEYIVIIRRWKIAHKSVYLSYDETTQTKKCIHPPGWQLTTFTTSIFEPMKNAILQITGIQSNILVVDIDGTEHITNKYLIILCMKSCKFYNKTKKGYHFFYKYNNVFPKSQSIKYFNDPTNSGLDLKSTNGCVYYGSYKIGNDLIKYENILAEEIVPMPTELINELKSLFNKTNTPVAKQRITKSFHCQISNTISDFPTTTLIDIATLDKLLMCFPINYFDNYQLWITICFLIKQSNHTEPAFQLFLKYSRSVPKYSNVSEAECRAKWDSIKYEPNFVFQEMLFIARKNNPKLFNTINLPWINYHQTTYKPIIFNSQFLNYDFIYPHYEANKILAIKSPYGTGKTQFIAKLFENIDPNTSVLFITPRVSLSYSHKKSFPQFFHYQNKTLTEIKDATKLIIQLDSIYKLDNTAKHIDCLEQNNKFIKQYLLVAEDKPTNTTKVVKYDIIALDEIESLLYHLSFEKINTQQIFNILKLLCINASKIIALDGDFSNRSHFFLSTVLTQNQTMVILENEYQPPPKHFIFTNSQTDFYNQIDTDLTNKHKIVLVCLTLETSEYFRSKYEGTYKVITHNSIQNDRQGLQDVNAYWQCDILIYTSTVESGCDHNATWFNNCYIILSNKGTTPRALMQMCNRVRHFSDTNVSCYTNGVPFYEFQIPYHFDEVKNTAFSTLTNSAGQLSDLDTILCYNEVETLNKQFYITILTQLILSKGHTYEYKRVNNAKQTRIKSNIYQEIADADNIASATDYKACVEILKKNTTPADAMRLCYCSIKKYIVAKVWKQDIKSIDVKDIKTYYPRINKLLNYKFFNKYTTNNNHSSFKNIKLARKITYIHTILHKFGITHPEQFDFSIDCGIGTIGRTKNKKENPNIINATRYNTIRTELLPIIKEKQFRFIFNLDKIKLDDDITNRQFLETIKKVINEFGFTIEVFQKDTRIMVNNVPKTNHENVYFIDLDECILELLNFTTRDYIDDILDNIPSSFEGFSDDEADEDEVEIDY